MLLGCGGPSIFFVLPIGLLALFVAANFPIGLAAMTSALMRLGLNAPVLDKVRHMNFATGLVSLWVRGPRCQSGAG